MQPQKVITQVRLALIFLIGFMLKSQLWGQHDTTRAQNVVLMIGDGMGITQVTAAMIANGNHLNLERMRILGLSKTASADDLITDSAAGSTAMACGKKTDNGTLGLDPGGKRLKSILEMAVEKNLATGLVATVMIQHATPAGFYAHQKSRDSYGAITRDLLASQVTLAIGGGMRFFDQEWGRKTLKEKFAEQGYGFATTLQEARKLNQDRIMVITDHLHLPVASERPPHFLRDATELALERLSSRSEGFFLMIEGSQIDWGGHTNSVDHLLDEMLDFDEAIGAVLDFAQKDGNTLVIVTSDHETGGLIVESGRIEDRQMDLKFSTMRHTGTMVPVLAYGPGAGLFAGIYENTGIFYRMLEALGWNGSR